MDGTACDQSAALELLPEVAAGALAAGADEPEPDVELPEDEELSEDDEPSEDEEREAALSAAEEVARLSVR